MECSLAKVESLYCTTKVSGGGHILIAPQDVLVTPIGCCFFPLTRKPPPLPLDIQTWSLNRGSPHIKWNSPLLTPPSQPDVHDSHVNNHILTYMFDWHSSGRCKHGSSTGGLTDFEFLFRNHSFAFWQDTS